MVFIEEHGDITKQPKEYVIAHCISVDCAMGAGVVVPICKKHVGLKPSCKEYVRKNPNALGFAYRYEDDLGVVYNMFSKQNVSEHAGYLISYEQYLSQLKRCLESIRLQMQLNHENYLAMPLIGCGLDRCKWDDVKEIILDVFKRTNVTIKICLWD